MNSKTYNKLKTLNFEITRSNGDKESDWKLFDFERFNKDIPNIVPIYIPVHTVVVTLYKINNGEILTRDMVFNEFYEQLIKINNNLLNSEYINLIQELSIIPIEMISF